LGTAGSVRTQDSNSSADTSTRSASCGWRGASLEGLEEQIFGGTFTQETTERIYDLKRELVGLKPAVSPLIPPPGQQ